MLSKPGHYASPLQEITHIQTLIHNYGHHCLAKTPTGMLLRGGSPEDTDKETGIKNQTLDIWSVLPKGLFTSSTTAIRPLLIVTLKSVFWSFFFSKRKHANIIIQGNGRVAIDR